MWMPELMRSVTKMWAPSHVRGWMCMECLSSVFLAFSGDNIIPRILDFPYQMQQ